MLVCPAVSPGQEEQWDTPFTSCSGLAKLPCPCPWLSPTMRPVRRKEPEAVPEPMGEGMGGGGHRIQGALVGLHGEQGGSPWAKIKIVVFELALMG